mgnify:CR=1 FL=1
MPNGMLNDLEFENQLSNMGDNQLELIKFVARQQFTSSKLLAVHDKKISDLETGDRKISGITGGISGTITSIIIGIISYLTNK